METRRETKRQVIALRTMLRSQGLTAQQRADMEANIVQLRGKLDSVESQINPTEIAARREFLHKNKGLLDIFNTFWVILLVYTTDGFLSKEGYSKFHHAVEIALAGEATFASVDEQALNADWTYDRMLYGNLNKIAFYDMLFELIGTYHALCLHCYYHSLHLFYISPSLYFSQKPGRRSWTPHTMLRLHGHCWTASLTLRSTRRN